MHPTPIWRHDQPKLSVAETQPVVAAAAEQLRAGLTSARELTQSWSDQSLGYQLLDGALTDCLGTLSETGLWGRDNQLPSMALWNSATEYLQTGWLQMRAREKPLGYAGDYQMLAAIIENKVCDNPLGRLFDQYFQDQAAPCAVRNRTDIVADVIVAGSLEAGDSYAVVSVGCGPALDVRQGIERLPDTVRPRVRATLLDLDGESLDFARQQVLQVANADQLTCHRENLFRLARRPRGKQLIGNAQLIVCTGLFDYLDDNVAAELLKLFWDQLPAGGRLLVGNFAPDHATRAYMEWIGNWYLTYRTANELENLAKSVGIPESCRSVAAEATGADLLLQAVKP